MTLGLHRRSMRVWGIAALALLTCLPIAAAQVPEPNEVVDQACGTLGGAAPQARDLLPVCGREDPQPAAPADPAAADAHEHPAAPEPGDPAQAARDIIDEVKGVREDPTSAPERLKGIVATILQFLKDTLGLPNVGLQKIGDAMAPAHAAIVDGAVAATHKTADAATGLVDTIKALLPHASADRASPPALPRIDAPRDAPDVRGLLGRLKDTVSAI